MLYRELPANRYYPTNAPNKARTSEESLRGVVAYPGAMDIGILGPFDILRRIRSGSKHIVTCDINKENLRAVEELLQFGPVRPLLNEEQHVTVEYLNTDIFDFIASAEPASIHSVFFDFEKCLFNKPRNKPSGVELEQLDLWKFDVLLERLTPQAHIQFTYLRPDRQQGLVEYESWRSGYREFCESIGKKFPIDTSGIDWNNYSQPSCAIWFALIAHHMFGYTTDAAITADRLEVPISGYEISGQSLDYRDSPTWMQTCWFNLNRRANPTDKLRDSILGLYQNNKETSS